MPAVSRHSHTLLARLTCWREDSFDANQKTDATQRGVHRGTNRTNRRAPTATRQPRRTHNDAAISRYRRVYTPCSITSDIVCYGLYHFLRAPARRCGDTHAAKNTLARHRCAYCVAFYAGLPSPIPFLRSTFAHVQHLYARALLSRIHRKTSGLRAFVRQRPIHASSFHMPHVQYTYHFPFKRKLQPPPGLFRWACLPQPPA